MKAKCRKKMAYITHFFINDETRYKNLRCIIFRNYNLPIITCKNLNEFNEEEVLL